MVVTRSQKRLPDAVEELALVKKIDLESSDLVISGSINPMQTVVARQRRKRTRRPHPQVSFSKNEDLKELSMTTFLWNNPVDGILMKDHFERKRRRKVFNKRKRVQYKENKQLRQRNEANWRNPSYDPIEDDRIDVNESQEEKSSGPELEFDAHGNIVLSEVSLINRNDDFGPQIEDLSHIGEDITYITSATYSRKKRGGRMWTTKETLLFYKALRSIGQDFGLISQMFPNRSRDEVKAKFKREEKFRPKIIRIALNPVAALPVDLRMLSGKREKQAREKLEEFRKFKTLDDLYKDQLIEDSGRGLLKDKPKIRKKSKSKSLPVTKIENNDTNGNSLDEDFSFEDFANTVNPLPEFGRDIVEELSTSEDEASDSECDSDADIQATEVNQLLKKTRASVLEDEIL